MNVRAGIEATSNNMENCSRLKYSFLKVCVCVCVVYTVTIETRRHWNPGAYVRDSWVC